MAVVFILSLTVQHTPDNIAMSERFRTALVEFCKEHGLNTDAWWNSGTGIRKLGHIIEYGILGFCSSIAFLDFTILPRKDGKDSHSLLKSLATVIIFCFMFSIFDQTVKTTVPLRHFDWTDVAFDMVGCVSGIGIFELIRFLIKGSFELFF